MFSVNDVEMTVMKMETNHWTWLRRRYIAFAPVPSLVSGNYQPRSIAMSEYFSMLGFER